MKTVNTPPQVNVIMRLQRHAKAKVSPVGIIAVLLLLNNAAAQPLQEIERHVDKAIPRHAGFLPTLGTVTSRSFTTNRCTLEQDGYFGATYGKPSLVTFGFELETTPSADTATIVNSIRSAVISKVLTSTFPDVCIPTATDQWNIGQIWGFQFMNEVLLSSGRLFFLLLLCSEENYLPFFPSCYLLSQDPCSPVHQLSNKCGSYESSLEIFGSGTSESRLRVMSIVQDTLSSNEVKNIDPEIIMVLPLTIQRAKVSVALASTASGTASGSSSTGSKIAPGGIALAVLAAVFGTAAVAAFQWRRYRRSGRGADVQDKTVCDDSQMNYDDVTHFIRRASTEESDLTDFERSREKQWGLGNIEFDFAEKSAAQNRWKWIV